MPTADKIAAAEMLADRLRSFTELDTSDADTAGYGAAAIAASNIAIASAIQDLSNAVWALQTKA